MAFCSQLESHRAGRDLTLRPLREAALGVHFQSPRGDLYERAVLITDRLEGQFGLIRRCFPRPLVAGLPEVSMHVATGPRRSVQGRGFAGGIVGTGVADTSSRSRLLSMVEAVERYGMRSEPDHRSLVRTSYQGLRPDAVPVDAFGLFSSDQYECLPGLDRPGSDNPIDWVWAYSLTNRGFVMVPAALAFSSLAHRGPNTFVYGGTSTGVATHVSFEAAVLSGIYEVIERDSVMITWLQRRSPPRIRLDPLLAPRLRQLIAERFSVPGIKFVLLDMTADTGIPTVACVGLSDDPRLPAAVMGAACRADPEEAARKALMEAAQVLYGLDILSWDSRSTLAEQDVHAFEDHARFYAVTANARHLHHLLESPDEVSLPKPCSPDIDEVVKALTNVGLVALVVDLTTPDVASCGLRTARVLVPGAVDINADPRLPYLGSPRIATVPQSLGWPGLSRSQLNLAPCPLA